jgi:hypothetical protein
MAEVVDALASGASGCELVRVQISLSVPAFRMLSERLQVGLFYSL